MLTLFQSIQSLCHIVLNMSQIQFTSSIHYFLELNDYGALQKKTLYQTKEIEYSTTVK